MSTRSAALDILDSVTEQKSYLNLALKDSLSADMTSKDKKLVTALVNSVIENLYKIDYILAPFINGKRIHKKIKNILRLGACQLIFFDGVPVYAAINESVKLAAAYKSGTFKGFVNAVLRNVEKNKFKIEYPDLYRNPAEYLHIMYSVPMWLSKKYISDYGFDEAKAIFSYTGENSLTCLRRNYFCDGLLPNGAIPGKYLNDAYYLKNVSDVGNMPYYKNGAFTPQSESSMLCVNAASINLTDNVLDICAAPGGKTAYAAWQARNGKVTAVDLYDHRVSLIKNNLQRMNVKNATAVKYDATRHIDEFDRAFDVVLADLPCSALGLLHRKPDIRVFKDEADLKSLAEIQKKILNNASQYVKPRGVLVYSTCTVDNIENESNVEFFLQNNTDFYLESISPYMPESFKARARDGILQLLPHKDGIDGFFIARLRKRY